jgi:probable HAF family extracellular repeat protein
MTRTSRMSFALTAALAAATLAAQVPPGYIVYDTGTLGGTFASGAGVNNLGWVTGVSSNASAAQHATLALPGSLIDLGTLGGTNSAVEWPVKNNHGQVVGISETDTPDPLGESFSCAAFIPTNGHTCLPFLWNNGKLSALPLLGGNNGFATGINNTGLAVGWAETAVHDPTCVAPQVLQFLAVAWSGPGSTARALPALAGDSDSAATAVNDAGEIVGISGSCDVAVGAFSARHAVLWVNGRAVRLPTLGGAGWNTPMAINSAGVIVGFVDAPGDVVGGVLTPDFQAVLWADGGIFNLHTLSGDTTAEATGINDFNQVVGTSFSASGNSRVFLWQGGHMYDLNALAQPDAPLYLIGSGDINDRGEITGVGCVLVGGVCGPVAHTFVAIPAAVAGAAGRGDAAARIAPELPAALRESLAHRHFANVGAQRVPAQ